MLSELFDDMHWQLELPSSKSAAYKINVLARMLAYYDERTWISLRRKTRRTYERAAANLLYQWKDFEGAMKELNSAK
jgi:hypothetical protein